MQPRPRVICLFCGRITTGHTSKITPGVYPRRHYQLDVTPKILCPGNQHLGKEVGEHGTGDFEAEDDFMPPLNKASLPSRRVSSVRISPSTEGGIRKICQTCAWMDMSIRSETGGCWNPHTPVLIIDLKAYPSFGCHQWKNHAEASHRLDKK